MVCVCGGMCVWFIECASESEPNDFKIKENDSICGQRTIYDFNDFLVSQLRFIAKVKMYRIV